MKRSALIIDDNPMDQVINEGFLEQMGFSSEVASSVDEAIRLMVAEKFDLILLDLAMPGVSGIQFLMGLEGLDWIKAVPVIVISGAVQESKINIAKLLGAKGFLAKPIDVVRDRAVVEKCLAAS